MRELGAFRVAVRGALALAPAVVVGVFAGTWPALVAALLGIVAVGAWSIVRLRRAPLIRTAPRHLGPAEELRVLVVANDALDDERFADVVARATRGAPARVFLLAPLVLGSMQRWASDTDPARAALVQRVADASRTLTDCSVESAVADDEPLQAIEDALGSFGADEVVVVTRAPLSELARQAYARFAVPVSHVVLTPRTS